MPTRPSAWWRTARCDLLRLHGGDDRLFAIVGPCSIHDHDQALDYAACPLPLAATHAANQLVVMRVYF